MFRVLGWYSCMVEISENYQVRKLVDILFVFHRCVFRFSTGRSASMRLIPAQGLLSHFREKVVAAVPRENFTCLDLDSILNGVVYCVGWKDYTR
jgi:hypothetical protein